MRRLLAAIVDRMLASIAPLPVDRAEQLADYEAGIDVFEPDELWAAAHLKQPADTVAPSFPPAAGPTPPSGVGGPELARCTCTFDPPLADWEQELHNVHSHDQ